MKTFSKPRITLGETLQLFSDEDIKCTVLSERRTPMFVGNIKQLSTTDTPGFNYIRDRIVRSVYTGGNGDLGFFLDPETQVGSATIDEFPKRDLYVAELLHFVDKKEYLMICNLQGEKLWRDRAENFMWTEEGVLHALALRKINWFECTAEEFIIYIEDDETQMTPSAEEYLEKFRASVEKFNCCKFCCNWKGSMTDDRAICSSLGEMREWHDRVAHCPHFKQNLIRILQRQDEMCEDMGI